MRRIISRLHRERGQVLVMFVGIFTIIAVVGFIVVDFGLWFSERRGAQTDADLSALAAAHELLSCTSLSDPQASTVQQAANDRAWEYAQLNDVTDPDNVHLPDLSDSSLWTGCWEDEGDTSDTIDSFPLDVEHPTRVLFGSIFGLLAPEGLGAHARACVGSVNSTENVMPLGVPIKNPDLSGVRDLCWAPDDDDLDDLPEPLYGKRCDLTVQDGDSGEYGWLDLDNPAGEPSNVCSESGGGAKEVEQEIENGGANTKCRVAPMGMTIDDCENRPTSEDPYNWCVQAKTGKDLNKLMKAFNTLVSPEGGCDTNNDGRDDFEGSLELERGTAETDSAFYEIICDSPRLVTLVIIDSYSSQGNPIMPIRAFATFFIEGVVADGVEYPKFDPHGTIGQFHFYGRFVNILGEGDVGPVTDWSPKRVILDE